MVDGFSVATALEELTDSVLICSPTSDTVCSSLERSSVPCDSFGGDKAAPEGPPVSCDSPSGVAPALGGFFFLSFFFPFDLVRDGVVAVALDVPSISCDVVDGPAAAPDDGVEAVFGISLLKPTAYFRWNAATVERKASFGTPIFCKLAPRIKAIRGSLGRRRTILVVWLASRNERS